MRGSVSTVALRDLHLRTIGILQSIISPPALPINRELRRA